MSDPLRKRQHLTHEELCRLVPDETPRYELIDGEAWMNPTPLYRHQLILRRLFLAFDAAAVAEDAEVLFAPLDVILAEDTALQPDLLVVLAENRHVIQDWVRGAPDLVVEVLSPSTARRDRGIKLATYARFGVREYWLVDPEEERVEIHRVDDEARVYRHAAQLHPGDTATTPLLPFLAVDVAALFEAAS